MNTQTTNSARSEATQARLVHAAIESLVQLGYAKTTGVEVCRRAGVTRGALNHHFPVYVDLLIAALHTIYAQLTAARANATGGPLERAVRSGYQMVTDPQFKAVIELWLASQNDTDVTAPLTSAIEQSATLFAPKELLVSNAAHAQSQATSAALYRTCFEALIGIGLGRATSGGKPPNHETLVYETLLQMAQQHDERGS